MLGSGQTPFVLEQKIAQTEEIRVKVDLMNELAWRLRIREPKRAHTLAKNTLELAQALHHQAPYTKGIAASLIVLSFLDGEAGRLETALSLSLEALSHVQDVSDPSLLIGAWYTLGWAYYYAGNYPASLEFALKALKLARSNRYPEQEAWCLDLVASTYKDPAEALSLYEEAYEIFERLGEMEGQSRILNNWAYTFKELGKYAQALEKAKQSLNLARKSEMHRDIINVSATIGEILTDMEEYEAAQTILRDAIALFDQYGRDISSVYILVDLGEVYLRQNDLIRAEAELLNALAASHKMEMLNEQARCHQYLSEIFEKRGQYDKALQHYKIFQELRESTAGEGAAKQMAALRVSHQIENAQRDAEIHRLQKEKLQNELDEHKRIHAILEELATRDSLTNLFNRRHFLGLAEQEWRRSIRYKHPICILMLDVDHFKQINDQHGHAVGDKALTTVAGVIQTNLRDTEIAGRYGGDEFVILLPETTLQNGMRIAERISRAIKEHSIKSETGDIELTPSIGIASVSIIERTLSLSELLHQADKALYDAKKSGDGQVRFYKAD